MNVSFEHTITILLAGILFVLLGILWELGQHRKDFRFTHGLNRLDETSSSRH